MPIKVETRWTELLEVARAAAVAVPFGIACGAIWDLLIKPLL